MFPVRAWGLLLLLTGFSLAQTAFDYIIVGGGTAGLTVANRLSETAEIRVAVIEPGQDERNNPNVSDANAFLLALDTPIDWAYQTAPQIGAGDRQLEYHSGKALGMTYVRGEVAQFDAWESIGNEGWNWKNLLPYFKKSEGFTPPTQAQQEAGSSYLAQYHGFTGPVTVGNAFDLTNGSLFDITNASWKSLDLSSNPDVNSGQVRGFSVWPQTLNRTANIRQDSARAYYYPVQSRPNLVVFHGTANKILWGEGSCGDEAQADGIEFTAINGTVQSLQANREVILSAGTLRTPAILELSGVGNPMILSQFGIKVRVNNPAVGENLQDQPLNGIAYQSTDQTNITGSTPFATFASASDLFGPATSDIGQSSFKEIRSWAEIVANASKSALNATALEYLFRIQHDLIFNQAVPCAEILLYYSQSTFLTPFWNLLPFTRGSVHIGSADPLAYPVINPNFFLVDWETTVQAAISRIVRKFWNTKPANDLVAAETLPGLSAVPKNATDAEWAPFLKSTFTPNSHPVGTASMLPRELGGVVDSELRVYGTNNVRVVDASVLPFETSGHLTSTIYAVSERISDVIKNQWH